MTKEPSGMGTGLCRGEFAGISDERVPNEPAATVYPCGGLTRYEADACRSTCGRALLPASASASRDFCTASSLRCTASELLRASVYASSSVSSMVCATPGSAAQSRGSSIRQRGSFRCILVSRKPEGDHPAETIDFSVHAGRLGKGRRKKHAEDRHPDQGPPILRLDLARRRRPPGSWNKLFD